MPAFAVRTATQTYHATVERGSLGRVASALPPKTSRIFVVTTQDVWQHHGAAFEQGLRGHPYDLLFFPGGEERKRLSQVETLAEGMVARGGDRASVVIAFGGGIVNDLGGFLAAIFMRGIPVIQVPTTLLAQVDAAVGGKTGANLASGKNLIGAFHQPRAVIIDPDVLSTLPEREFRAGLAEVLKCGIIRDPALFQRLASHRDEVLRRAPEYLDPCIADSVRLKCDVVSADEKEGGLRRILNFGHTIGHAIEAETAYAQLLHGEAVALGMKAATRLAHFTGFLSAEDGVDIIETIDAYGPWPRVNGLDPSRLMARLAHDKKTLHGSVHFVLPVAIGETTIESGLSEAAIRQAIQEAIA